jgi:phosphoglycerate kinase
LTPKRPFYALIGGAKISTKMGVLKSLAEKTDGIFIGGGMAFTFLKAQGIQIGNSIHEDDQIPVALDLLKTCVEKKIPLWLPMDSVIADAFNNEANTQIVSSAKGIPEGWEGMDIGPKTITEWTAILSQAATVFWNGPLGVCEFPKFFTGTKEIAQTLSDSHATTVVGGGDSVAAINQLNLTQKFSHVSTGGGASLEYIEYGHLPGIDALSNSKK